jgi:hypothetical protein
VHSSVGISDSTKLFLPSGLPVQGQCCGGGKPKIRPGVFRGELFASIQYGVACPDTHRVNQQCWLARPSFPAELGGVVLFPTSLVVVTRVHHNVVANLQLVVTRTRICFFFRVFLERVVLAGLCMFRGFVPRAGALAERFRQLHASVTRCLRLIDEERLSLGILRPFI